MQNTETDQSRLNTIQNRLSQLRLELENKRTTKFEDLMKKITDLSSKIQETQNANETKFKEQKQKLTTLQKEIEKEQNELEAVFETKTQELEAARAQLSDQIKQLESERLVMSKDLLAKVEADFATVKESVQQEQLIRQDESTARTDLFDQDLPRIKAGINTEREQTKYQLSEIEDKVKKVIAALSQMLHQEKQMRTKWQSDLQGLIIEVDKRLNGDLLKERRAREQSEKQLIHLLEQATQSYLQFDEEKL